MLYRDRLLTMIEFVEENIDSVDELVVLLDITVEDVIRLFPDRLVAKYKSVFPPDVDDNEEEEDEAGAWRGFHLVDEEEES